MNVMVIDLGMANIRSLTSALTYLGAPYFVADDPARLADATHVVLPGVGAFDAAMRKIDERALRVPLREYAEQGRPLLGVCLGMQLLFEGSEEGECLGLGVLSGRVLRLGGDVASGRKVPHVGFSAVRDYRETGLFAGLGQTSHFYFTHSYAVPARDCTGNAGICDHTLPFLAAIQRDNVCGAQFHPEKSQTAGLRLISNFLDSATSPCAD